jgi:uncharacterized protein YegP (UPF0339 family)
MRFETSKDRTGRWRWTLRVPRIGKIARSTRGYRTRLECVAAIELVRMAQSASIFMRGERQAAVR